MCNYVGFVQIQSHALAITLTKHTKAKHSAATMSYCALIPVFHSALRVSAYKSSWHRTSNYPLGAT